MGLFDFLKKKQEDNSFNNSYNYSNYNESEDSYWDNDDCYSNFEMTIDDIFTITGRGTIVVGKIINGEVRVNEFVSLCSYNTFIRDVQIIGIEQFREQITVARKGQSVGILLKDISRDELHKGYILRK